MTYRTSKLVCLNCFCYFLASVNLFLACESMTTGVLGVEEITKSTFLNHGGINERFREKKWFYQKMVLFISCDRFVQYVEHLEFYNTIHYKVPNRTNIDIKCTKTVQYRNFCQISKILSGLHNFVDFYRKTVIFCKFSINL